MTKEEAIKNIPIGSIWQDKYSKEAIEITSIREESYMGGDYQPYQSNHRRDIFNHTIGV